MCSLGLGQEAVPWVSKSGLAQVIDVVVQGSTKTLSPVFIMIHLGDVTVHPGLDFIRDDHEEPRS